jgi:hypothetical protein
MQTFKEFLESKIIEEGTQPKRQLSVFDKHQLKIARQTLRYSDAGANIMGGMTKDQARAIIKRLTGKDPKE